MTLLPTEHGGRSVPVASGYRPQFYYAGDDWDAEQTYRGVESVRPGETVRARISFFNPEAHRRRVFEGMPFLIREGNRVVGYGRVFRLLALPGASGGS
jgi:elongation factor Tu